MKTVTIYHNPRCSKSRETLQLLEQHGVAPEVILYLENPPSSIQLHSLLQRLHLTPAELIRSKEPLYKELGLAAESSDEQLIEAMVKHPKLIERPIVVNGDKAALGRPPEQVLAIL